MGAGICATVLFFLFAVGDLKFEDCKLQQSLSGLSIDNISRERSRIRCFDVDVEDVIVNLLKFVRLSNLEIQNATNYKEQGKSTETDRTILPLALTFKITGLFLLSLVVVKFFLLKGFLEGKIALIILGVIFARKIRRFGTLTFLNNHHLYSDNEPGQYPTNEPNLSGYGYEYNYVPGFRTPEQKYS